MSSTTAKVPCRWLFGCCLLAGISSCEPAPTAAPPGPSQVYDYYLSVDDTNPMQGIIASLTVKAGHTNDWPYRRSRRYPTPAHLFAYSHFQWVRQPNGVRPDSLGEPRDTLAIPLTRAQTDSIYGLTRQVFHLLPCPPARDSTQFPRGPAAHDLDNYVGVTFRCDGFHGPTFTCQGYPERNAPSYALRVYLLQLKARSRSPRP